MVCKASGIPVRGRSGMVCGSLDPCFLFFDLLSCVDGVVRCSACALRPEDLVRTLPGLLYSVLPMRGFAFSAAVAWRLGKSELA